MAQGLVHLDDVRIREYNPWMISLLTSGACSFMEGRFTSMTRGTFLHRSQFHGGCLWQRTNSQVGMVHVSFTFVDRLVCGGVGLTSMDEPSIAIDG